MGTAADGFNATFEACAEICEIASAEHRRKLQEAMLDYETLKPFLSDNVIIDKWLADAGIASPGERSRIMSTLRSIN